MRSRASEFPNDNAALHGGAVWLVSEPCGSWRAEMAMEEEMSEATTADPTLTDSITKALTATEYGLDDGEGEDGDDIEIVDEFEPMDFELEPKQDDPFALFVAMLVEVAVEAGCEKAAAILPALLDQGSVVPGVLPSSVTDMLLSTGMLVSTSAGLVGGETFRRTAAAWRAILRGDSEDFSACGTRMLDEWAADLLAGLVAAPAKSEPLRRQLRTRGVAAFGLVLAA
jgi:hypothetical protein